ncbi:MAG: ArnT family glycosyltransferase [Candidatus Aenigmatarchaeota archaeon]
MLEEKLEGLEEKHYIAIILTVFFAAELIVIYKIWNRPPIWDSAVYIGMGKALFSAGEAGLWENFRPPLMPVLLGFVDLVTDNISSVSRLLSLTISTLGAGLIYVLSKRSFDRETAFYTASLVLGTGIFFLYTNHVLTGILASVLVFTSLCLAREERYFLSGLVVALAFLTRFPAALVGAAVFIYIVFKSYQEKKWKEGLEDTVFLILGFALIAGPYFLLNQLFYGDFLFPITRGLAVPQAVASTDFMYGLYFYLGSLASNPFLALFPLGIYFTIKKKESKYAPFLIALLLFYGFFTAFSHKEVRFALLFLPLMSLLTARVLKEIREREIVSKRMLQFGFSFVVVFLILSATMVNLQTRAYDNPGQDAFYSEASELEGTVAANDPLVMVYGDFRYAELPPGRLEEYYERNINETDYVAINSCNWYCPREMSEEECEEERNDLRNWIETDLQEHFNLSQDDCQYLIYKR